MQRQQPTDRIPGLGTLTLGDFWSWAYSDILSNLNRAAFAEFLVASALGFLDVPRAEWDAVDLRYRGHGIEVKASAYLQSWPQESPSTIRFDIAPKRGWDANTNTYAPEPMRTADCYVFCLFPETEPDLARSRVLDSQAWEFYILPTERLNEELGDQKTVGIARIRSMCSAIRYPELKEEIELVLDTLSEDTG